MGYRCAPGGVINFLDTFLHQFNVPIGTINIARKFNLYAFDIQFIYTTYTVH